MPNAHRVLSPLSFPQVACTNVGNPIWATEVIISSSGCLRTLCLAHSYPANCKSLKLPATRAFEKQPPCLHQCASCCAPWGWRACVLWCSAPGRRSLYQPHWPRAGHCSATNNNTTNNNHQNNSRHHVPTFLARQRRRSTWLGRISRDPALPASLHCGPRKSCPQTSGAAAQACSSGSHTHPVTLQRFAPAMWNLSLTLHAGSIPHACCLCSKAKTLVYSTSIKYEVVSKLCTDIHQYMHVHPSSNPKVYCYASPSLASDEVMLQCVAHLWCTSL